MNLILEKFDYHKRTPSDINEHMETLLRLSKECNHITEMGVRFVVSTWAFLSAKPNRVVSYDISYHDKLKIDEVTNAAKNENIDFSFILSDVLQIDIEETDLLFIDTLHTYTQLSQELLKHACKVKKYIVLHDTETFGSRDENLYEHASYLAKKSLDKKGLKLAIVDFLSSQEGSNWRVEQHFVHNNGLTVLKRK